VWVVEEEGKRRRGNLTQQCSLVYAYLLPEKSKDGKQLKVDDSFKRVTTTISIRHLQ
jgi:hypothetical protein